MLRRTGFVTVMTLLLAGGMASAQLCTGDCNVDGDVTLDEVVLGLNIALGRSDLSDCTSFDTNQDGLLTVDELVGGVEAALHGRQVTARGACQQPGGGGLTTCPLGTMVRVFECRSLAACTGGGDPIAEAVVDDTGEFSTEFCTVGDVLIFEATIDTDAETATYRSIEIVDARQLADDRSAFSGRAAAGGPDFTLDGILISPNSEVTARLLDENGLQNFDRGGVGEILAQINLLNPDSFFAGLGAGAAANRATDRAREDEDVGRIIEMLLRPDVRGLRSLSRGDLRAANEAFRSGVDSRGPSEEPSNFYYAITRIATTLLDDPRIRDLATRSGVSVKGTIDALCDMKMDFPAQDEVPLDAPRTGEMIEVLRNTVLPAVEGAITNLSRLSSGFQLDFDLDDLPECVCPFPRIGGLVEVGCRPDDGEAVHVQIDQGDVLVLAAAVDGVAASMELAAAYDVDFALRSIFDESAQDFLALEPRLLEIQSTDRLAAARDRLDGALDKMSRAIESVQSETDDQEDDLLVIAPEDSDRAAEVTRGINLVRQSLTGEVVLPIDVMSGRIYLTKPVPAQERLNLNPFFSGQLNDLRGFLPAFDTDGDFDTERFPDPTFGGTAPDLTQQKIDDFFVGGPPCAPCEENFDCNAYTFGRFDCYRCFSDCTGDTKRCGSVSDLTSCEDGNF